MLTSLACRSSRLALVAVVCAAGVSVTAGDELRRRGLFGVQLAPAPAGAAGVAATPIPDTPAAGAGLEGGDIIVGVNGDRITDMQSFFAASSRYYGGDKVKLDLLRDGKPLSVEFELATRPTEEFDGGEVLYEAVPVGEHKLRAIVTRPSAAGSHPAILVIPDLGPQSLDFFSPMMAHPIRQLLHGLSARGVVTMRVEPSGVGDSQGPPARDAAFEDYVKWYQAGLAKLAGYDFVDPRRVYIFAYGLGGVAAPQVAGADSKVAGVITYGVPARTFLESRLANSRRHMQLEGYDAATIADGVLAVSRFMSRLIFSGQSPSEIIAAEPSLAEVGRQFAQGDYVMGRHYKFFQQIGGMNIPRMWEDTDARVLSLRGAADWTSCREDAVALAEHLNELRRGRAKFVELAETDGMFQKAGDMEESYLAQQSPGEFNPLIIDTVVEWIGSGAKAGEAE